MAKYTWTRIGVGGAPCGALADVHLRGFFGLLLLVMNRGPQEAAGPFDELWHHYEEGDITPVPSRSNKGFRHRGDNVRVTWDRATKLITGLAAGALLTLGSLTLPEDAHSQAVGGPKDALTLVRQALAALEVSPPAVSVATEKVINALFARDTRGVDMARVQEAARSLGQEDFAAAAAQLIDALRPARLVSGGSEVALLVPVQPHFSATPTDYGFLVGAALLLAVGGLIIRR